MSYFVFFYYHFYLCYANKIFFLNFFISFSFFFFEIKIKIKIKTIEEIMYFKHLKFPWPDTSTKSIQYFILSNLS